jgi:hypothetical protein
MTPLSQLHEQIPNDDGVHNQHDNASDRDALCDFEKLKWYQRTRDDYREVFRPPFLQPQTRSFSQKQPGVEERTDAQLFELAIVHHSELGDQRVNEPVVGINSDLSDPIRRKFRYVPVQQPECPNSDRDQQQALDEFEDRDYPESLAVGLESAMSRANWFRHIDPSKAIRQSYCAKQIH